MDPAAAGSMVPSAVAVGIGGVLAVVDWAAVWAGGRGGLLIERVAKPAFMVALLVATVLAPTSTPEAGGVRPWLLAGLAASLAGDILLLPPSRFVPGLGAFLIAQLAYLVAFLLIGSDGAWLAVGVGVAALVAATVGRVLVGAARSVGLGGPVAVYLAAITLMAVGATRTGVPAAIAGAWLFVASDALVGWGRFRAPRRGVRGPELGGARRLGVGIMVTYHVAQLLLWIALVAP